MPCTTIIIRHLPSVSIIADAVEAVRPHRATATIRSQRAIDRDRLQNAAGLKLPPMRKQHVLRLRYTSLPIVTCDLEQSP